jgi:hypothetical protein
LAQSNGPHVDKITFASFVHTSCFHTLSINNYSLTQVKAIYKILSFSLSYFYDVSLLSEKRN